MQLYLFVAFCLYSLVKHIGLTKAGVMYSILCFNLNIVPPLIANIAYFLGNNISSVPSHCFHLKLQFCMGIGKKVSEEYKVVVFSTC